MPADCLPLHISSYPKFFICNSDEWYRQGTHWLLVMFKSATDPPEFFDSFARAPDYYNKLIKAYLVANSQNGFYTISGQQVQPDYSSYCGYYCLTVADYFSQGYSLANIMTLFDTTALNHNDELVQKYVDIHMRRLH